MNGLEPLITRESPATTHLSEDIAYVRVAQEEACALVVLLQDLHEASVVQVTVVLQQDLSRTGRAEAAERILVRQVTLADVRLIALHWDLSSTVS